MGFRLKLLTSHKGSGPALVRDPVCGRQIPAGDVRYETEHKGRTYFFCSPGCKSSFKKQASFDSNRLLLAKNRPTKSTSKDTYGGCH